MVTIYADEARPGTESCFPRIAFRKVRESLSVESGVLLPDVKPGGLRLH